MLVSVILVALSLPVVAWAAYLAALAILSRALPPRSYDATPKTKFDVIVPAHNEELGISATVTSLLGVDYPPHLRRIVVVADNCTDATAARAAEAGATVLERFDASQRGKGYALAYAFERTLADGVADGVVVVDADTTVTKNLLGAFGVRRGQPRSVVAYSPDAHRVYALSRCALSSARVARGLGRPSWQWNGLLHFGAPGGAS
jgi:glycosyltransferase involved in cell wall biosynthesis